jgi:putative Holliday junction resolvase
MPESALRRGYILAFDYGLRRIGVAVGQFTTLTATPLETVGNGKQPDWSAIDRLVREWKPSRLLLGLPLGSDGEETDMSRAARRFAEQLASRFSLPVSFQDERLSSFAAQEQFARLRSEGSLKKKHARGLDAMAAQVFLENWLQSESGPNAESAAAGD